jgi:hypothetical protein
VNGWHSAKARKFRETSLSLDKFIYFNRIQGTQNIFGIRAPVISCGDENRDSKRREEEGGGDMCVKYY